MPVPPTAEQWESHRATITDMYSRRPLKAVRVHMRDVHGFHATDRMYKGRFKTWGIEKNRRLNKPRLERPNCSQASPPSDDYPFLTMPSGPEPEHTPFQRRPDVASVMTPPGNSPPSSYPESDCRSVTYPATPGAFPPTPASSRHRSPTVEEQALDVGSLRTLIVDLAISILSRLVPHTETTPEDRPPTHDHVEIFQTLQTKLRHESQLRGCLVNRQPASVRALINEPVRDMLRSLHPAAPIGVLSTFNQLSDWSVIQELAKCLVESSWVILPSGDDFTQLALAIQRLLVITTLDTFLFSMGQVCERLEDRILALLGARSLVRVYLTLLLNAKKAKSTHQRDDRIFSMAMERAVYVQHAYADNAKLLLDFNLFIVAYLSLVTPGASDVLDMAELCYNRAEGYLRDKEESGANIRDARTHFGKSCAYLAECRYAQAQATEEQLNTARGLLLMAILCHSDCAEATLAHVERHMIRLQGWCDEANDTVRLQQLEMIREMIEGKEQRPKGEPLLPRLKALM